MAEAVTLIRALSGGGDHRRLEHNAGGFIYRSPDDTPAGEALARWATEVVPAAREAITR